MKKYCLVFIIMGFVLDVFGNSPVKKVETNSDEIVYSFDVDESANIFNRIKYCYLFYNDRKPYYEDEKLGILLFSEYARIEYDAYTESGSCIEFYVQIFIKNNHVYVATDIQEAINSYRSIYSYNASEYTIEEHPEAITQIKSVLETYLKNFAEDTSSILQRSDVLFGLN